MSVRVAIAGAGGRMGRALLEAVASTADVALAASFDIGDDVRAALAAADVLVDFTRPEGTRRGSAGVRVSGPTRQDSAARPPSPQPLLSSGGSSFPPPPAAALLPFPSRRASSHSRVRSTIALSTLRTCAMSVNCIRPYAVSASWPGSPPNHS